jgi:predicted phage baseplate assembly protein
VLEGQALEVRELDDGPWVPWTEVVDFHGSTAVDRHYVLTRATGEIAFGDGAHGAIPPRGRENVRLARYRTGGGEAGNRPAGAIARLLSTIPYVDAAINVEPAFGGIAAEDTGALVARGPRILRHGGRAVVAQDFEDLAYAASGGVARARAVPTPGRVGVVIVPLGDEERPMPDAELIERVEQYVRERSGAIFDLWVAGPGWLRVDVEAELVPTALELATDVENAVRARLRAFLHPLTGGTGSGWPLGRRMFRSDLRAVIERTPGVDHMRTLRVHEVATDPSPAPDAFLICSGEHRIRVVGGDGP